MARDQDRNALPRVAVAVVLAAAQPLSTRAARWAGRGVPEVEAASVGEGPVTPAGGAFVIWAPLFGGCLLHAGAQVRGVTHGGEARAAARWANAAMAGNVAWSLNSQFRRLDEASVALILGSATAATVAAALAEPGSGAEGATVVRRSFGALAGWLSVAAFANVETTLNLRHGRPDDRWSQRRAIALIAAASTVASAASVVLRGNPFHVSAAGWGLGGIAVKALRGRQRGVLGAAGCGLLALGTAGVLARSDRAPRC